MTPPDGRKHHRGGPAAGAGGLTLMELLDTEQALNAMVGRADAEAAEILSAAREQARRDEAAADAGLAAQMEAVEAEATARTAQAVAEITSAADAEAGRFDSVPDEMVVALGEGVVRDFLGSEPLVDREAEARP